MALIASVPPQPVIIDSFWNLIATSDEAVQRELLTRLENKFVDKKRSRRHKYTDEEMEQALSEFSPITVADFPEPSKEDYIYYARMQSGKLLEGMSKWL